jgi:dTMP kinase
MSLSFQLSSANKPQSASIRANLTAGTTVIIDRYYYSGCVYSAAKRNPSLNLHWARHPEEGLPRPDLCVFLKISPEEAKNRGGFGTEKYEREEMQRNVRELFEVMMGEEKGEDFVEVDAGRSLEGVKRSVREVVDRCLEEVEEGEIRIVEPW